MPASTQQTVKVDSVDTTKQHSVLPWRDKPLQTVQAAAEISGVSTGSIYRAAASGDLVFRRLAGRTLVETASLIAFIDSAEAWQPSARTGKAVAARAGRAAQARG